jgi:hypothetical protein
MREGELMRCHVCPHKQALIDQALREGFNTGWRAARREQPNTTRGRNTAAKRRLLIASVETVSGATGLSPVKALLAMTDAARRGLGNRGSNGDSELQNRHSGGSDTNA